MCDISQYQFELYVSMTNKEHSRKIKEAFTEGFMKGSKARNLNSVSESWNDSDAKLDLSDLDLTIRLKD